MLANIIAVAIGFSLIMLLLSLIVTSLGQATQAVFRLRGRNLRVGIATALAPDNTPASQADLNEASELMNRCDDTALREKAASINVDSGNPLSEAQIDKSVGRIVERFVRLKKPMQNRFKKMMRGIALIWAVVVAAVFQISTPTLLHELSTDPALQAQLLDAALEKIKSGKEELSLINISPLQHGWSFYTDGASAFVNILGVLLTAILLALGAPFWFGALETTVKWRDLFAPKPPPESDDTAKRGKNE